MSHHSFPHSIQRESHTTITMLSCHTYKMVTVSSEEIILDILPMASGQFTLVLGREVIYSAKTEDDHAPTTSRDLDR